MGKNQLLSAFLHRSNKKLLCIERRPFNSQRKDSFIQKLTLAKST